MTIKIELQPEIPGSMVKSMVLKHCDDNNCPVDVNFLHRDPSGSVFEISSENPLAFYYAGEAIATISYYCIKK